jgi:hypothetical protein
MVFQSEKENPLKERASRKPGRSSDFGGTQFI